MSCAETRKRSNNFSSKEVEIMINLVEKYKSKIECRKTDRTSNYHKTEAWLQLAGEFNSMSGEAFRSAQILRNKYENLKKRSKQRFADEKLYRRGTGGGPDKPVIITEVDEKVKEIIGSQITGLDSEFDGDREKLTSPIASADRNTVRILQLAEIPQDQLEIAYESNTTENEVFEICAASTSCLKDNFPNVRRPSNAADISTPTAATSGTTNNSTATSWSQYTPSQLRTPKSQTLKTKCMSQKNMHASSNSQLSNRVVSWANNKAEIASEQLKFLREEHELKMKQMKEKHEWEMTVAREEREERDQFLAQQRELQLEILKQQLKK